MSDVTPPTPTENISLEEVVRQRSAVLARHYIAAFNQLLAGMHPAKLAHPDTVLVVESKEEEAAFRVLLDAHGYPHIKTELKLPAGPSRAQRRRANRSRQSPR